MLHPRTVPPQLSARHVQALDMDCYHASPAAVDAATHLGALWDTDRADQPRVPVALQLYRAQQPSWQQVPSSFTLCYCGAPSAA